MAATTHDPKDTKVIRFPKPLKGIANRDRNKRLPSLTSADVENFFSNADAKGQTKKLAA